MGYYLVDVYRLKFIVVYNFLFGYLIVMGWLRYGLLISFNEFVGNLIVFECSIEFNYYDFDLVNFIVYIYKVYDINSVFFGWWFYVFNCIIGEYLLLLYFNMVGIDELEFVNLVKFFFNFFIGLYIFEFSGLFDDEIIVDFYLLEGWFF